MPCDFILSMIFFSLQFWRKRNQFPKTKKSVFSVKKQAGAWDQLSLPCLAHAASLTVLWRQTITTLFISDRSCAGFFCEKKRATTMRRIVILIAALAIVLQLTAVTPATRHEGRFQLCFKKISKVSKSSAFSQHICTIWTRKCNETLLTFLANQKRFPTTYGSIGFHLLKVTFFKILQNKMSALPTGHFATFHPFSGE